jgi:hypothetical protein
VQVLERPQVAEVEDRAEVDVEAVGPLAGEHLDAAGEVVHRLPGELAVVRGGERADVAGRAGEPRAELVPAKTSSSPDAASRK